MTDVVSNVTSEEVLGLVSGYFTEDVTELKEIKGGNMKQVFSFKVRHTSYIIKFSVQQEEFLTEKFINKLVDSSYIKRVMIIGTYKNQYFAICEKALGVTLKKLSHANVKSLKHEIIESIMSIHRTPVRHTTGYGWITTDGVGRYESFRDFIMYHFQEEQYGFWENWYDLFKTPYLERQSFMNLYDEMLRLSTYCEGKRYVVHGDFHFSNIISDGNTITGIIDWGNVMYGDYLLDVAMIHMQYPQFNFKGLFKKFYQNRGIDITHYNERFICLSLFKGLDTLRFFAKTGNSESCESILNYLYELVAVE